MMTVNELSKLAGVSVRTLHYYDTIGLLKPAAVSPAGYRLYDTAELERLQQILLFRELEFPLKEIKDIVDRPGFDRKKALSEQIELLVLKKERLENLIAFAGKLESSGGYEMDFEAFDDRKIEKYKADAKKKWGDTQAYREYENKAGNYSDEKQKQLADEMMGIFAEFGKMTDRPCSDAAVQALVKKLKDFITENYYTCTDPILSALGRMYAAGGEMTDNIDAAGGEGTALFAAKAIEEFCG